MANKMKFVWQIKLFGRHLGYFASPKKATIFINNYIEDNLYNSSVTADDFEVDRINIKELK